MRTVLDTVLCVLVCSVAGAVAPAMAADIPAASSTLPALDVQVPPFPAAVAVATTGVVDSSTWKDQSFKVAKIHFNSPFPSEGIENDRDLLKEADARDHLELDSVASVAPADAGADARVLAELTVKQTSPSSTLSGEALAAMINQITLHLLPEDVPRSLSLTLDGATTVIPIHVTLQTLPTVEIGPVSLTPRSGGGDHYVVNVGQWLQSEPWHVSLAEPGVAWVSLSGRSVDASDQTLAPESCTKVGAFEVRCKPTDGYTLESALASLRQVALDLGDTTSGRELVVRAAFETFGGTVEYDIAKIEVRPALPVPPSDCVKVTVRKDQGWHHAQLWGTSRVVRSMDALAGAYVGATVLPPARCVAALSGGYRVQLELRTSPIQDGDDGEGSYVRTPAVALAGASPADATQFAGARYPFASAWLELHAKDDDAAKKQITDPKTGALTLFATVMLVSPDGTNAQPIRRNVPVTVQIDLDPLYSFGIVNHPASTTVAVVQCRDIVGDSTPAETDGNEHRCVDVPQRPALSDQVATIPIGFHFRWTPFYQRQWLGFGADASVLAIGETGLFTSNDTTETTAGLIAPLSGMVGFDMSASNQSTTSTHNTLSFLVGGGLTMLEAKDGNVVRWYFGGLITVPITTWQ